MIKKIPGTAWPCFRTGDRGCRGSERPRALCSLSPLDKPCRLPRGHSGQLPQPLCLPESWQAAAAAAKRLAPHLSRTSAAPGQRPVLSALYHGSPVPSVELFLSSSRVAVSLSWLLLGHFWGVVGIVRDSHSQGKEGHVGGRVGGMAGETF